MRFGARRRRRVPADAHRAERFARPRAFHGSDEPFFALVPRLNYAGLDAAIDGRRDGRRSVAPPVSLDDDAADDVADGLGAAALLARRDSRVAVAPLLAALHLLPQVHEGAAHAVARAPRAAQDRIGRVEGQKEVPGHAREHVLRHDQRRRRERRRGIGVRFRVGGRGLAPLGRLRRHHLKRREQVPGVRDARRRGGRRGVALPVPRELHAALGQRRQVRRDAGDAQRAQTILGNVRDRRNGSRVSRFLPDGGASPGRTPSAGSISGASFRLQVPRQRLRRAPQRECAQNHLLAHLRQERRRRESLLGGAGGGQPATDALERLAKHLDAALIARAMLGELMRAERELRQRARGVHGRAPRRATGPPAHHQHACVVEEALRLGYRRRGVGERRSRSRARHRRGEPLCEIKAFPEGKSGERLRQGRAQGD